MLNWHLNVELLSDIFSFPFFPTFSPSQSLLSIHFFLLSYSITFPSLFFFTFLLVPLSPLPLSSSLSGRTYLPLDWSPVLTLNSLALSIQVRERLTYASICSSHDAPQWWSLPPSLVPGPCVPCSYPHHYYHLSIVITLVILSEPTMILLHARHHRPITATRYHCNYPTCLLTSL